MVVTSLKLPLASSFKTFHTAKSNGKVLVDLAFNPECSGKSMALVIQVIVAHSVVMCVVRIAFIQDPSTEQDSFTPPVRAVIQTDVSVHDHSRSEHVSRPESGTY